MWPYISLIIAGVEAAHIAGILGDRGTVLIFGVLPVQAREVQEKMLSLGLHSILQ